ncbi:MULTISPECIES: ATP-binding protein [unclassified Nitratiruptor]|uniref:tRNA 2-thiocytidine biosynthesis TtcA family protein n=1 Tax=unclassified Nitratiruptor TaxID=2624044 RepID=UPI001915416A|nr:MULTISPECIES: ATP-binding protein [unclassified Nitratiruptor]BCD60069.1 tRNA 2-thiocytidine biosynthesis protein TtcA [Nitratiruptor sp. YY08-10]BCD64442.1 tRNA 2-thiocytidine biosynthesis protein TtcA [Nitratiruptor sp. YY08-14]
MKRAEFTKKLIKQIARTNVEFELLKEGDRVLVGLSGGKDSLTLVHALKHIQRVAPYDFTFKAVTISYGMGENYDFLTKHCEEYGIEHTVYETEIFDLAKEKIRTNSSYCSFFSRMRRGALYTYALQNGFNKLALGHHLDDAIESFFMNMFYNGAMRSMPPIYKSSKGLYVIRPLIETREKQLQGFVERNGFMAIGDEMCPAMRFDIKEPYVRENMKAFVSELEGRFRDVVKYIRASFRHIHDDTFFDKERLKV